MSGKIILVTGASSGFGRLSANAFAQSGHIVYASMRETAGRFKSLMGYALLLQSECESA